MISLFVSSRDKGWEPPSPVRASRFFENAILECRANLSLALSFDPSEAEFLSRKLETSICLSDFFVSVRSVAKEQCDFRPSEFPLFNFNLVSLSSRI